MYKFWTNMGLFTYYVSQKWGGPDPPLPPFVIQKSEIVLPPLPPLSEKNQKFANPPSPLVRNHILTHSN